MQICSWHNGIIQSWGNAIKKPMIYFRYLDDIWILCDHGETQFQTFFDILNTHSPAILLSARVDKNSIDFLDVTVSRAPN